MAFKAFRFACRASVVLFYLWLCAFLLSFAIDPDERRVSLAENLHVSLWKGSVVIFSDGEYGPYRGSILYLVDENGDSPFKPVQEIKWGETAGIYVRYFRWPDATLWTVWVSCLWPMGLCLIVPTANALRRWWQGKQTANVSDATAE